MLVESISDEFDVESLLETDESLSFRRRDIGPEVVRKLRRGVWALQAQLDLHGMRRDEARERLAEFMRDAGAARAALRARDPRQGQRLAGTRAGAQGQGQELAGAAQRGARVHAGPRLAKAATAR